MPPVSFYGEITMDKKIISTQICTRCETGKKDFELDKKSLFCSHIDLLKNGKCQRFVPISNGCCSNLRN